MYDGFAHLLPAQAGWQAVADDALDWALRHAERGAPAYPAPTRAAGAPTG